MPPTQAVPVAPCILPFVRQGPVARYESSAVIPQEGVWRLVAEVWDGVASCPYPTFPYAGRHVSWKLVDVVTGEVVVMRAAVDTLGGGTTAAR